MDGVAFTFSAAREAEGRPLLSQPFSISIHLSLSPFTHAFLQPKLPALGEQGSTGSPALGCSQLVARASRFHSTLLSAQSLLPTQSGDSQLPAALFVP